MNSKLYILAEAAKHKKVTSLKKDHDYHAFLPGLWRDNEMRYEKMKLNSLQRTERKIIKLVKKIHRLTRGNHVDVVCYSDGTFWIRAFGFDEDTPDEWQILQEFNTNIWSTDI